MVSRDAFALPDDLLIDDWANIRRTTTSNHRLTGARVPER